MKKEIKKNKFNKTYSRYIRNFTNDGYRKLCITDLRKNPVNFTLNTSKNFDFTLLVINNCAISKLFLGNFFFCSDNVVILVSADV